TFLDWELPAASGKFPTRKDSNYLSWELPEGKRNHLFESGTSGSRREVPFRSGKFPARPARSFWRRPVGGASGGFSPAFPGFGSRRPAPARPASEDFQTGTLPPDLPGADLSR